MQYLKTGFIPQKENFYRFCFFKSFLLGILICVLCKSSFANYGTSCSLVPVGNTTFLNNTAYGYIKSFIEMQQ